MKRLFGVLMVGVILLFTAMVDAAPFLVCDPQPNATQYIVEFDGVVETVTYNTDGPGGSVLLKDLAGIDDGPHAVIVRAMNFWGLSDPVPFDFVKELPVNPSGVALHE